MPIAHLHILEGRSDELKAKLIANVTTTIAETLGAPLANIRVLIQEVPKTQWGIAGESVAAREARAAATGVKN